MAKWNEIVTITNELGKHYKDGIYDKETGKVLDVGQALCRELYGVDWMESEDWKRDNDNDDTGPTKYVTTAQRWIDTGLPDWASAK